MKVFVEPGHRKTFINVCQSDVVSTATSVAGKESSKKRGQQWQIPYSITPDREDQDKCEGGGEGGREGEREGGREGGGGREIGCIGGCEEGGESGGEEEREKMRKEEEGGEREGEREKGMLGGRVGEGMEGGWRKRGKM